MQDGNQAVRGIRQKPPWNKPKVNSFQKLNDEELLKRGTVMIFKGKVGLINDHVVIPFKLDVSLMRSRSAILLNNLYNIKFEITQNARNITLLYSIQQEIKILSDRLKSQITHEEHMYIDFFNGIDYISGLEGARGKNKRSPMDIIGYSASYLFGLATTDQIMEVNNVMKNITDIDSAILKEMSFLSDIANSENAELSKLKSAQIDITNTLNRLDEAARSFSKALKRIDIKLLILHALNNLNTDITNVAIQTEKIKAGLEKIYTGKLSDDIISDRQLLAVLIKAEKQGYNLLLKPSRSHIKEIKSIITVRPSYIANKEEIIFFIAVPIGKSEEFTYFNFYKLLTFPIPLKGLEHNLVYPIMPTYIGISKKHYIILRNIEECQRVKDTYFCKNGGAIHVLGREPLCVEEIIFNKGSNYLTTCNLKIANDSEPQFYRSLNKWIYFLPKPETFQLFCENGEKNQELTLAGLGTIVLTEKCVAQSRRFLLTSTNKNYLPTITVEQFNLPYQITFDFNVSEVFKNSENYSYENMNITELLNIMDTFKIEPKLKNLHNFVINNNDKLNRIKKLINEETGSSFTLLPMVYPIIIIIILGLIYKIKKIYASCKKQNEHQEPSYRATLNRGNSGEIMEAEINYPSTPEAPPHAFRVNSPKSSPIPVPRRSRSK